MTTITVQTTLTRMTCGNCGIAFAIPEVFRQECEDDGGSWYCPNGHSRIYRESDAARLRKETVQLRHQLASRDEDVRAARADSEVERNRATAYKGHVTRVKRRVARGKCPCCSRSFPDLAGHMADAHPGYEDDRTVKESVS